MKGMCPVETVGHKTLLKSERRGADGERIHSIESCPSKAEHLSAGAVTKVQKERILE